MNGTLPRRRALALLLAWGAGVIGLSGWAQQPAAAATIEVSMTMTSLEVTGTKPSSKVVLTGTVTNTGDIPAYGVQVILWRSRDPIRDLPTLQEAATNAAGWGSRLPISSDHYAVVTTSMQAFNPGESRQVRLNSTLEDLGFDTRGAAYAFGADVIANPDQSPNYGTVGQVRTFVPIPGEQPVPLTSIVLLSAPPTKLMDNLFRNDDLVAQLSGRLDNLLTAAARPQLSWLIDPALLDEIRDMADGYHVVSGDGTKPGTGQQVATAWLARFDHLNRHAGGRTLFANPDVNGARLADVDVVTRAEEAADEVDDIDDLPLVIVPAGGVAGAATYEFLAESGAAAIVASNAVRAGALQAGSGKARVLAVSAEVPGAAATPTLEQRQQALAAAVIAGSGGQARLLTGLADLTADDAAAPDWLQRRDLGELLATTPSVDNAGLKSVKPVRLSREQFGAVDRLSRDLEAYSELAPDSEFAEQADAALSRCVASSWTANAAGFNSQLGGVNRLVGAPAIARAVVLDASPRFLMSGRSNQFPVTMTNKLTEPIRVRAVIESQSPQRLTVPPSDVVTIQPDQSVTVNVQPEATANGLVLVRAHVATESGHRVSPDTTITVEVTDLGVVAWIIVGVSGLVLIAATAWRIRQVRRKAAAQAAKAAV